MRSASRYVAVWVNGACGHHVREKNGPWATRNRCTNSSKTTRGDEQFQITTQNDGGPAQALQAQTTHRRLCLIVHGCVDPQTPPCPKISQPRPAVYPGVQEQILAAHNQRLMGASSPFERQCPFAWQKQTGCTARPPRNIWRDAVIDLIRPWNTRTRLGRLTGHFSVFSRDSSSDSTGQSNSSIRCKTPTLQSGTVTANKTAVMTRTAVRNRFIQIGDKSDDPGRK